MVGNFRMYLYSDSTKVGILDFITPENQKVC